MKGIIKWKKNCSTDWCLQQALTPLAEIHLSWEQLISQLLRRPGSCEDVPSITGNECPRMWRDNTLRGAEREEQRGTAGVLQLKCWLRETHSAARLSWRETANWTSAHLLLSERAHPHQVLRRTSAPGTGDRTLNRIRFHRKHRTETTESHTSGSEEPAAFITGRSRFCWRSAQTSTPQLRFCRVLLDLVLKLNWYWTFSHRFWFRTREEPECKEVSALTALRTESGQIVKKQERVQFYNPAENNWFKMSSE